MSAKRHILLTGIPGIGKTTTIMKICTELKNKSLPVRGFYTEEVRDEQRCRIGFDIIALGTNKRIPLARSMNSTDKPVDSKYHVGQYAVYVNEFEKFILPLLENFHGSKGVIVIDEIGKMECFSNAFKKKIEEIYKNDFNIILATIPVSKGKPIQLIESLRSNPSFNIITVNKSNRNELPKEIFNQLHTSLKS